MKKYIDYDYTTAGIHAATVKAAEQYDHLLNKYYKIYPMFLKVTIEKPWWRFKDPGYHTGTPN